MVREKVVSKMSKEDLLAMAKECLEELDIPYEEKPGGFIPEGGKMVNFSAIE